MQKHLKQATAVMLTLLVLLSMIPLTAFAVEATPDSAGTASGTTYQCTWTVENGVLTISGNGEMENYNYPSFEP